MTLSMWFWIFFVLALLLTGWRDYESNQPNPFRRWGGSLFLFVLFGLLGWAVFGSAVK